MRNRSCTDLPSYYAPSPGAWLKNDRPYPLEVYDITSLHFHDTLELGVCSEGQGVCRVEDIGHPQGISEKEQLYYTLAPVYDKEVIYTPVDTKAFMRPVMSRADAERFIDRIPEIPEELNGNRDIRMQSEKYRACLNTHENEDLVRLIKTVYRKNHRSMKAGRHMGSTDQPVSYTHLTLPTIA